MTKNIRIIGVPLDLGQDRRGVDMGPAAVRAAGLQARIERLGYAVKEAGNVDVAYAEQKTPGNAKAKYLKEIARTCQKQADWVRKTLEDGASPLVLGGDHSIAVGTVSGVSSYYRDQHKAVGLIWLDAHGDFNTPETTPSGNIHGMPLACLLGRGPKELTDLYGYSPKLAAANTVLVGVHSLDEEEKRALHEAKVKVFTMRDIDERGMRSVVEEAIAVASNGTEGFCTSLDLDFIDAAYAPGVGTPVRGGATYREAHLALEIIADSDSMLSLEVVEVNPVLDEHNRTAELAVELISSALGKKIF
ncbi:MAG: arginase [Acidobacteria bacterium]|nr:MAG: arginase [Acidobacteriota bacterium]